MGMLSCPDTGAVAASLHITLHTAPGAGQGDVSSSASGFSSIELKKRAAPANIMTLALRGNQAEGAGHLKENGNVSKRNGEQAGDKKQAARQRGEYLVGVF